MPWPLPTWPARSTPSSPRPSPLSRARATSPRASPRPTTGCSTRSGSRIPGRERFLDEVLPRLRELGIPLWVSVGGFAADEYAETCAQLHDVTIEVNLSCPNVDEAPESAAEIVAACRASTSLPIYAKLSPAQPDMGEAARAVQAAGADGLSLVNTIRGLELEPATLRPRLARGSAATPGRRSSRSRSPPSTPHSAPPACPSWAWEGFRAGATRPSFLPRERARSPSEPPSSRTPARRFGSGESWTRRRRPWGVAGPKDLCGIAHEPDFDLLPPALTTSKTPAFQAN